MRLLKIVSLILLTLVVIYMVGPNPLKPVFDKNIASVPAGAAALEQYVGTNESLHKLKPGNQAEIIWEDRLHRKTPYAIVYLHGFSASREEGSPVHTDIAKQFGCNLYLSRLSQHGVDTVDAMANLTADNLWESAKEALAIGMQLGDKVILMGTSTGGSLALQLAATYPDVAALVLLSPNIEINDPNAWLLNNPWGLQIARLVIGGNYNVAKNNTPLYKQFWNKQYRLEAAVQLQEYLEDAMKKETFSKIHQPVLLLYYYKDEQHQDPVVKVSAMKTMLAELGTPAAIKQQKAIPTAENHVLGSYILSKDVPAVENEISRFLSTIIKK
ncbi:MAG: alpha/beta hydrolase [Chitinophagaceae bacterium]|nr:alpha/beta hydrolase [Chitinophagaceae bacterium]